MQLFGIRGSVTYTLMFVVAGVLIGVGVALPLALLGGLLGGTLIALALFAIPPLARAADRADRWLRTPR